MTPTRKFNQNVWWILQEIISDEFYAPKGEKVEFSLRPTSNPNGKGQKDDFVMPDEDAQRKLLRKLEEWDAIANLEVANDILRGSNMANPRIYKFYIARPQFDAIYSKLKNKFCPPEKFVPAVSLPPLIDKSEEFQKDIYMTALKSQDACRINIGDVDDLDEGLLNILRKFNNQALFVDYKETTIDDEIITEYGESILFEILVADVKFDHQKIVDYLREPWNKKWKIVEKLARYYLDLIRVVEAYFKNPQKIDDKLNRAYETLCEEIENLIYKNGVSDRLRFIYKKPFNSLFSAEEELKKNGISLKEKLNDMRNFYGEVQKILLFYDISSKSNDKILEIEKHLSEIESPEIRHDKPIDGNDAIQAALDGAIARGFESMFPKTPLQQQNVQKIEITGIPPLELKEPKQKQPFDKVSLKSLQISYDDNNSALKIGKQNVALPPYKNEHYLCRAMYEHNPNEPTDWSEVYEKITGYYEAYYGKPPATKKNWRIVYDAMDALNKRVKETINTDDDLFSWQEKTIKRNF